ncbi:hypothetical protein D9M69_534650 [compost metagenome]
MASRMVRDVDRGATKDVQDKHHRRRRRPGPDLPEWRGHGRRLQGTRSEGRGGHHHLPLDRRRRRHVQEGHRQLREGHRRHGEALVLAELRAADRDRHQGRLAVQPLRLPAARPGRQHGRRRWPDAAGQQGPRLGQGQLRRRQLLGRPGHLQEQGRQGRVLRFLLQRERQEPGLVHPGELQGKGLQGAQVHGGAAGSEQEDRRRRRQALVHRPGQRRRHRLARDRLGRRHDAAHPEPAGLRRLDQQQDEVQRQARG